jgi:hypothetical protein
MTARAPAQGWRLIRIVAIASALGLLVAILAVYFQRGFIPGDAFTYLAAGERLNAGHPLYELGPGDRPVAPQPPNWTVPLLSPPTIAVAWRALAAMPSELGVYVWWAFQVAAVAASFVLIARHRPVLASVALIVLVVPFTYEIGVGNLNGFVLLGLILTWRATARHEERVSGILAAALTAFKMTPVILGWWLLTCRRWTAIRWAIGADVLILSISLLGAGLHAHVRYVGIVRDTIVNGSRPLSLAGMARFIGVAPEIANFLPTGALIAGVIAIWLLRRRPDKAFVVSVFVLVFGSPTVSINWFVMLFAALAPMAWPWQPIEAARPGDTGSGREVPAYGRTAALVGGDNGGGSNGVA